jgi:hypothetical protein
MVSGNCDMADDRMSGRATRADEPAVQRAWKTSQEAPVASAEATVAPATADPLRANVGESPAPSPSSNTLSVRQAAVLCMQQTRGNQYVARMLAQRQADSPPTPAPASSAAASAPASTDPAAAVGPGLIVDDGARDVQPGQMTKSAFLVQVRTAIDNTVEQTLAGSPWAALARPKIDEQIEQQFAAYGDQDGPSLERAIRQHVPAAGATTAQGLIVSLSEQVRQTITTQLPGSDGATGAVGGVAGILFQAREGSARDAEDPRAIQSQLAAGHGLDSGFRVGMESAFGQSFSDVRVHSDATAGQLSENLNAQAFTVGHDVAFGAGE